MSPCCPAATSRSAPQISAADLTALDGYEVGAYGHWALGPDAASLTSLGSTGKTLTLQGDAPSYAAAYADIEAGDALLTSLADSISQSLTMCMVLRIPSATTGICMLAGNFENGLASGRSLYRGGGSGYLTFNGDSIATATTTLQPSSDTWYFLAVSHDVAATSNNIIVLGGGVAAQTFSDDITGYATGPTNIGLGDSSYNASGRNIDVAEFVLFDSALSATALAAIYARSVTRAAARGITVTAFS